MAAELARRGFTGARHILGGSRGFFRATASEFNAELATRQLGEHFHINDISFKYYPSRQHTHAPVDCALQLVGDGLDYREVRRVRVYTNSVALGLVSNNSPLDTYGAKFSAPYSVAAAFQLGELSERSFEPDHIADPELRDLAKHVELLVDPELEAAYPERWASRVRVETAKGPFEAFTDCARGDPCNPLTPDELEAKFVRLAGPVIGEDGANRLLKVCAGLPFMDDLGQFHLCLGWS